MRSLCAVFLLCTVGCFPNVDLGANPDGSSGGGAGQGGGAGVGGGIANGGGATGGGLALGGGAAVGGGTATGGGTSTALAPYCTDAGWCYENPLPLGVDLNGVWALSDNEAWTVGDRGMALHFLNGVWTIVPTDAWSLTGVSASGPNDVWATGAQYTMKHWDGTSWSDGGLPELGAGDAEALECVWVDDAQHAWAGGTLGIYFALDAGHWIMSGSGLNPVRAVWGTAPDDIWFSNYQTAMVHYDGTKYSAFISDSGFGAQVQNSYGLWGASRDSYWAGGLFGQLLHYDGGAWGPVGTPGHLRSIWGSSDDDIWAVGLAQIDAGRTWQGVGGDLFHGDHGVWSSQRISAQTLMSVHGSSSSNVWAVGSGGTVLHKGDGGWTASLPQSSAVTATLYSVWGSGPNDVWAVGADAGVMHSDGSAWTPVAQGMGPLFYVHGTGPSDVWVVGPLDTKHWDGHSWSERATHLDAGLTFVYARTAGDVWGATADGALYRWAPATGWSWAYQLQNVSDLPPGFHVSIWASGPNDVYAGGWGPGAHFDGGTWGPLPKKTTLGPGSDLNDLAHVWGTGPNNVYVDEGNGEVFIWDGSGTWQFIQSIGGYTPIGIDGSGPNDVWMIDRSYAKVHHWDGTQWTASQLPTSGLYALTVTDPHHVWAVGTNGQILRLVH
jgi:hypothetical protein